MCKKNVCLSIQKLPININALIKRHLLHRDGQIYSYSVTTLHNQLLFAVISNIFVTF